MARILSFEVSDELYSRIATQQQKERIPYLSSFLRALINDVLTILEHHPIGGNESKEP